jgi:hypothetical protein
VYEGTGCGGGVNIPWIMKNPIITTIESVTASKVFFSIQTIPIFKRKLRYRIITALVERMAPEQPP